MNSEEKRRELFEAHWSNAYGYSRTEATESGVFSVNDRGIYRSVKLNESWHTWNAALDAVVIALPPSMDMPDEDECSDYEEYEALEAITCTANGIRHACRAAIESTGLGLKVLP